MESITDFKYRVAQVLSREYRQYDTVLVCTTPKLVQDIGFSYGEIHIAQKHLHLCLAPEDDNAKEHRHDLPIDFIDNLPRHIESPAMILASNTQSDSIVLVTDCKDKKDRPIIVALKNAGSGVSDGGVIDCNFVTSAYGKDGFLNFLNNSLRNNGLLYFDIKKSRDLVASIGLQLPEFLAKCDSNVIIRRYNENVNTFKQKFLHKSKNYTPEQYGLTLDRPDGLPLAYSDSDGRQRLYEYARKADGTPYLAKTTVTFSDERTEITEYNARGRITLLERMTADGRESYGYYAAGSIRSSETSTEYYDNDDYFARKSVHEKTREKKEACGYYHNTAKESWRDFDERDNIVLSKYNVYGDNGKVYHASEIRCKYDGYGNVISREDNSGCIDKIEYYPPSKVRDHFGFEVDDYDAGAIDHDKVKKETSKYSDGSIRVKQFTLEGKYTESQYSPDGKLTSFCDENGTTFQGKAAERALLKSCGQAPSGAEARSGKAQQPPAKTMAANGKSNKGKPDGKPSSGNSRGSSGR